MSPWDCPGLFIILPFLEHQFGIYHVEGGLNKISEAMAKVIEKNGGKIYLNSPVAKIITENKKAKGIILKDGTKVLSDNVIINADFSWAALNLFEKGELKKYTDKSLAKKKYSCSTFMVYLALDKTYTDLPHHNIVFSQNYRDNMDDIFKKFTLTEKDFSYYVRNSSINDTTVAPDGKSQLYCLVPVPNNKSNIDWKEKTEEVYEELLSSLENRLGLKDIREHIIEKKIVDPKDWEENYNVFNGAVFSMAHTMMQMLYFRPKNKFEEIDNCYIVGGGTHPGSGLPTIYESARIATKLIEKNK